MAGERFEIKAQIFFDDTGEVSDTVIVHLDGDLSLPEPVKNFKITSQTDEKNILGWDRSVSENVVSYAISVNVNFPFFAPGTVSTYELPKMALTSYAIEIWAIDSRGTTSIVESVTVDGSTLPIPEIHSPAEGLVVSTKPTIIGVNGAPGATVNLYKDGTTAVLYGSAIADTSGNWSTDLDVALAPGPFTIVCNQTLDGQLSPHSLAVKFYVADKPAAPHILFKLGDQPKIFWV